ncbi:ABC transporter permease subunit [Catenulispora yoronensis]|uniref:ABC transporter permease subunit n=1 Tax=Catenulispora yoronensis TaxID=450799 RepID=A0ABN2UKN5_9ACTN
MSTSVHAVRLVAAHEFRMRLRTGRWKWLLGGFTAVMLAFTWFLATSLNASRDSYYNGETMVHDTTSIGPQMFGILMLFVLGLMLIISPTLTSQSINGDRERGTLATLQVTLLSPTDIAIGKLLAGWSVGLVALALSVPFVLFSVAQGGVGFLSAVATLTVVALLIGVICAVAQALSALMSRSISSGLLSYLATAALTIGTLITYFLALSATSEQKPILIGSDYMTQGVVRHPEEVWWLLSPNPFVILADAAPALPPLRADNGDVVQRSDDPLGSIRRSVRDATLPDSSLPCGGTVYSSSDQPIGDRLTPTIPQCPAHPADPSPVWPWGLGFDLLLGAFAVTVTIRRLRTPATRLGRGVRVA